MRARSMIEETSSTSTRSPAFNSAAPAMPWIPFSRFPTDLMMISCWRRRRSVTIPMDRSPI